VSSNQILVTATASGAISKGYVVAVSGRNANGTPTATIATNGGNAMGQSLLGIAAESCASGVLFSVVVSGVVDYAVMGAALALGAAAMSGAALTTNGSGKLVAATLGSDQVVCKLINLSDATGADTDHCSVVMGA
jgi:hypothetical protein